MPIASPSLFSKNRIAVLKGLKLSPQEFCHRHILLSPDERGYRSACVREIATVCGISPRTVERWWDENDYPEWLPTMLQKEDLLRQINNLTQNR